MAIINNTLGQGMFGKVTRATWNGKKCAIKTQPVNSKTAKNELKILKALGNTNMYAVRMVHFREKGNQLLIFMEFATNGSLCEFLSTTRKTRLTDWFIKGIARQLINGLEFLHSTNCILHRDIKPGNILVFNNGKKFKLADFGISKLMTDPTSLTYGYGEETPVGTILYMAPELFVSNAKSTKSCDYWALGASLMFCLAKGEHYFIGENIGDICDKIISWKGFRDSEKESWRAK